MPDPQVDIDTIKEITDMFIEAGIHMDAVNVEGLTAAQICHHTRKHLINHHIYCTNLPMLMFIDTCIFLFFSIHSSVAAAIRIQRS